MFDNVIKIHLKQHKFLLLIKSKIHVYFLKREANTFDENIFPWFLKKKKIMIFIQLGVIFFSLDNIRLRDRKHSQVI